LSLLLLLSQKSLTVLSVETCFDVISLFAFSALTLLVGRQACKKLSGGVVCLEQGADLNMAQLTPLPLTVSCFSKIQISFTFTFLVPADELNQSYRLTDELF